MTILLDKRNFWPLLWKPKEFDGNRQAIRQNTSLKTAFAGACGLKYVLDVLIYFFWQLNQVIERSKKTGLIYLTSHLLFHERIWPGKSKISLRVFSCEEGKRMEII